MKKVKRVGGQYVQGACGCGWAGTLRTTRDVEGWRIAERDVQEHSCPPVHEDYCGYPDDCNCAKVAERLSTS